MAQQLCLYHGRQLRPKAAQHARGQRQIAQQGARADIGLDVILNNGAGDLPDVDMWVQPARHALNHHHGALQKDQLRPRFHAESFGNFKEIGQKPGHGDAAGIHTEDGFAHHAQGAGKLVYVPVCGHIACLEMHLCDAAVIFLDEAIENFGIDAAGIFIQPAHDAEIIGDHCPIAADLEVALVHVSMKIPVAQGMAEEQLQHPCAQSDAIMPGGVQRSIIGQCRAFDPVHCHHGA